MLIDHELEIMMANGRGFLQMCEQGKRSWAWDGFVFQ